MNVQTETKRHKDWWAPVWKGLVMDESAAHFQRMGTAIWLFVYLLLNANRNDGTLVRKVRTISSDMGVCRRTVFLWLEILRGEGYVETESSGRFLTVKIRKWKPVGEVHEYAPQKCKPIGEVQDSAHQKCKDLHLRSARICTSQTPLDTPKPAWLKEKLAARTTPKENIIKKNILKNDIDNKKFDFKYFDPLSFKTREELLAYDLAKALEDFPGYPLYLTLARKYPESLLRETVGRVKEIPSGEIRTSRGALFNFLIQKSEIKSSYDPRH